MNNYTALLIVSLVVAVLLSVSAVMSFLNGSVLPGALQALGAVLFAAAGIVVSAKRRDQDPADT
ncbi:hypothetical protein [Nesterenkonia sp.]|uniref:hypothetical protein n=1 Tax=Nesterenkonia sp. TaxID=704201 RepID=UPI00260F216C|nr:hypothetical protein [Nesterenkonia sp.]